jgi:TetR/AcrR family transcriptional repressor of nem operon
MAKSRKDVTHRRIVETAGASFRRRGLSGIGIADLMKEAGLTHGGFYAHFASKDVLVAEVLRLASERLGSLIAEAAAAAPEGEKLMAVAARYLTSRHREHPENGCSIATLGAEIGRESGAARQQVGTNIETAFERMAERSAAADSETRRCADRWQSPGRSAPAAGEGPLRSHRDLSKLVTSRSAINFPWGSYSFLMRSQPQANCCRAARGGDAAGDRAIRAPAAIHPTGSARRQKCPR